MSNTDRSIGAHHHRAALAAMNGIVPSGDPRLRGEKLVQDAEVARVNKGDGSYAYATGFLNSTVRELCRELAVLKGYGAQPQNGAAFARLSLGDAEALVEYEVEEASGDGWNDPHYDREVTVLGAYVNGVWIDIQGVIAESVIDGWREAIEQQLNDAAIDDKISHFEDQRAERIADLAWGAA